jgi:hypothetical protein
MILERLKIIVPPELLVYRPDCCILASKLVVDVLSYFGKEARPLMVRVFIANAPLVKRFEAGNPPKDQEELRQAAKEDGSHSIGLGYGYTEGKWSGHLVIVCEGEMLDLTLTQANRPAQGIHLEPVLVPVSEDFLAGKTSLVLTINETLVKYHAFPNDHSYQDSPDWKRFNPLAARIIQQV